MNNKDIIICPHCQSQIKFLSQNFAKCHCDIYPILEGIVYLQKTPVKQRALNYLQQKNENKALACLVSFSLLSRIFFRLTFNFRGFYKKLGFKNFINLLQFLGYSYGWAKYLKNREKIPSFFISLLGTDLIENKKEMLIEIGCGSGNLFPHYYRYLKPEKIIGIDKSFLNLYLARLFFAKKDTLLICIDIEKGIPFQSESVEIVLMSDFLHYIKNKDFFIKELARVTKKNSRGAIFHMLNKDTPTWPGTRGEKPPMIFNKIRKAGFKSCLMFGNEKIWELINNKGRVNLEEDEKVNQAYAYNLFFGKNKLPKMIILREKEKRLLKETKINFYQDPNLKIF